jgi:hypothetical protein
VRRRTRWLVDNQYVVHSSFCILHSAFCISRVCILHGAFCIYGAGTNVTTV